MPKLSEHMKRYISGNFMSVNTSSKTFVQSHISNLTAQVSVLEKEK